MLCAWNRRQRACAYFPAATEVLGEVKKHNRYVQQMGFLLLRGGTSLDVHVDPFNFLLSVHICLTPTPDAGYTVDGESVATGEGQCVAFDNSFQHTAWNRGTTDRIVLAIHTLHPSLTPIEKEILRQIHPILARPPRWKRPSKDSVSQSSLG
jgi:aspartate beta-hydroxylase